MARFGSLGTQYFNASGEPLVNGLIYFYESGTTTPKATYADINQAVANPNPVVLDASGYQPNIFFNGVAKAVLATSANVQIQTRDPVGDTAVNIPFQSWVPNFSYSLNDLVLGSNGEFYISLENGNIGNDPTISPSEWGNAFDSLIIGQDAVDDGFVAIGDATTGLAGLDVTAKGSILAGDGATAAALAPALLDGLGLVSDSGEPLGLRWGAANTLVRTARTSNTIITQANSGQLIEITSGTFSQTFDPSASLGPGFFLWYENSGTGVVTLDPNGAETINGAATLTLSSDMIALITCNGSNLFAMLFPAFTPDEEVIVTAGNGYGSTNNKIRRFTTTQKDVGGAITYADSSTLGGTFTAAKSGLYAITFVDGRTDGASTGTGISLNSNQLTTNVNSITAANRLAYATNYADGVSTAACVSALARLAVGDVVRAHNGGDNLPQQTDALVRFAIRRIGP